MENMMMQGLAAVGAAAMILSGNRFVKRLCQRLLEQRCRCCG